MKALVILALALSACASVPPEQKREHLITLSAEQKEACDEQGGCIVVSRDKLLELMKDVAKDAASTCGGDMNHTTFNQKDRT